MASSTDESKTNTLPDPELNPLLNPLLAAHMGRWAEVYFTNPPEKRAEAIAELLRELEKTPTPVSALEPGIEPARIEENKITTQMQGLPVPTGARATEDSRWESETARFQTSATDDAEPPLALEVNHTCAACAHVNPTGQFFCGMCGTRLDATPEWPPAIAPASPTSVRRENLSERSLQTTSIEDSSVEGRSIEDRLVENRFIEDRLIEDRSSDYATASRLIAADRERSVNEPFAPAQESYVPTFAAQSEPSANRLYTGFALAVLFVLLIYMAWRGTRAFTASSQPAAPVTSPSTAAAQTRASENSKTETPITTTAGPATPTSAVAAPSASVPSAVTNQSAKRDVSENQVSDSRPTAQVATNAAGASPDAMAMTGSEEFAMAQKYLNGGANASRNPSEAVPWLWRAIGKGNLQAAVALSDLYLRGDGVAKSCDQARVLLDSAVRKGGKVAADRLRNLQAFGCQ